MDFTRSAEHEAALEVVTEFVDEEIAPRAAAIDAEDTFPGELISEMGALGLMGMPFPAEYGGAEMSYPAYADAVAEISRASGAVGTIVAAHTSLAGGMLHAYGSDEQREKFLVPLCEGEDIGAFALSEPSAGSDVASLRTRAIPTAEGYRLEGEKLWTSNGSVADTVIAFAKVGDAHGREAITAFVLRPAVDEGFEVVRTEEKLGDRGCPTAALSFNGVEIRTDRRIGAEGAGFRQALECLNSGRISIAARGVGIARAAVADSVAYATEREQFGGPIADLQAIQHKLADMALKVRLAELAMFEAAAKRERGAECIVEAAMAKLYASEVSREVSNEAIQIHGGYGYVRDFPVERYYRDAKLNEIYEGTSEILRNTIARRIIAASG